jgi:hypothetical protein
MVARVLVAMVAPARPADAGGAAREALQQTERLYAALFYGVVLLVILAFGLWALVRMSRRYQEHLRHRSAKPTPVPDVWSMHRPPAELEADESDEEPDYEP